MNKVLYFLFVFFLLFYIGCNEDKTIKNISCGEVKCDENSHCEEDKCVCNEGFSEYAGRCVEECGDCENWEYCDLNENKCVLKQGRCRLDSDCTGMICDEESHYCYPAKNSWTLMPSANGIGAILFDKEQKKLITYFPHIYKQKDENSLVTPNLLYDFYFGIRLNSTNKWLNEVEVTQMEYIEGTGIIKVFREYAGLEITEYYWTSMLSDFPVTIAGIKIKNKSVENLDNLSIFTLGNFRVGGGNEHNLTEKADFYDNLNGFYERNWIYGYKYYQIFFMSGKEVDVVSTNNANYNPWLEIKNNNVLTEYKTSGESGKDDVALFFQKNFNNIAVGNEVNYYVVWNTVYTDNGTTPDITAEPIKTLVTGKSLDDLLLEEKSYWRDWHSVENLPQNLTEREKRLALQSSAFIKMGQVREEIGGKGQIVASLPPGIWNISWIRDMSYAIVGLIKNQHFQEAKEALEFIFARANTGRYDSDEWNVLGNNYQISVCRYYANGDEETDWNEAGPNIEYDGFGLALWALDEYVKETGDVEFLSEYQSNIFNRTADILISLIDDYGLISPDSSIWEYHWVDDGYNGKRHFAYTSVTAYKGLNSAKRLAGLIDRDFTLYQNAAETLKQGIINYLIKEETLLNFPEFDVSSLSPENGRYLYNIDASTVEAFNFGLFEPDSEIASKTLQAYKRELGNLISGSPGFKRTNKKCEPGIHASCVGTFGGVKANEYDIKEWIMVDFRILNFLRKRSDESSKKDAEKLYNWILTQSEYNYFQIAELYDEQTALYKGAVPMCGFGPGAYLIDLYER